MNPVAKNMPKVHKPSVEVDRKREEKKTGAYLGECLTTLMAGDAGKWAEPYDSPTNGNTESIDLPTEED